MKQRAFDVKQIMAYPDDFDIIKVTALTAGAVLPIGMIVYVTAVDTDHSGLPAGTIATDTITIAEETTLVEDDAVTFIGYCRDYAAILIVNQPTFAADLTSVVVAGEGKNMSLLNSVAVPTQIIGYFNRIQIPRTSATMILVAYK